MTKSKSLILIVTVTIVILLVLLYIYRNMGKNSVKHPNVQAFLKTIRMAEGTNGPDGYRTMFTGKLFDSYAAHPRQRNCANGFCSTAAGAYQFLYSTWSLLALRLALTDFSPESQDLAAVELIRQEGALEDVKAGRFEMAIDKVQNIWASLPDVPGGSPASSYGQPEKSIVELKMYYQNSGGSYA